MLELYKGCSACIENGPIVLVHSHYHSRIPQTGVAYKQQKSSSHRSGGWELYDKDA